MSAQEFYEQSLEIINAIPEEKIIGLPMPQEQAVAEAQQLIVAANRDRDALLARGLNPDFIDSLPARAGTLAYAAVQFDIHAKGMNEFQTLWKEKEEIAYNLRKKIIEEFDFAFRNNSVALRDLREVKKGRGNKDMILDLLAVHALGNKYPDELTAISFDMTLLDSAKSLHEEVSAAYAKAMIHNGAINEARVIRDRAYTWLKEATDEIRDFGKFVFSGDEKYDDYVSEFFIGIGNASAKAKREKSKTESEDMESTFAS